MSHSFKTPVQEKDIVHETTCLYTPQQNEVVECEHMTIMQVTRSLMLQSNILVQYWGECVKVATYLVNRLPYKILDFQTPFERVMGSNQNLNISRHLGLLLMQQT